MATEHEGATAGTSTTRESTSDPRGGLYITSFGNVGLLVLLFFPWMHVSCRMSSTETIEADVRGIDLALGQPAPELRDLPWNRGKSPKPDWHLVFLAIPGLVLLVSLWALAEATGTAGRPPRPPSSGARLLVFLCAVGLAGARLYCWWEFTHAAEQTQREFGAGVLTVTWYLPFWASFGFDALNALCAWGGSAPDSS